MSALLTAPRTTAKPSQKLMTAEEFWDFRNRPENQDRVLELVRGEVVEMSRPSGLHGVVAGNVVLELKLYCRQDSFGVVASNDSGVLLDQHPDTLRGPDVAIYTGIKDYREIPNKWFENPPLLAVEIRSPNDGNRKLERKIADYLNHGVKEVWVVDYEEEFITIHRPDQSLSNVEAGEVLTSPNLPGFSLKVAGLFSMHGVA